MEPNNKFEGQEHESFKKTALWTGGALAIVAGLAIYAGLQG